MNRNEYRALRKKYHMCTICGNKDAFTLNGRALCSECAEKKAEYERERRKNDEFRTKINAYQRDYIKRKKSAGLCVTCGKPVSNGHITCERCLSKERQRAEKTRRENGILPYSLRYIGETCCLCCKNKALENKKMCKECYEKMALIGTQNLEKARKNKKRRNECVERTL